MKLTLKGIGWLIAGLIVCASSTKSVGLAAKMSTIALGLVFVAVYLIKQFFTPKGIGWFIAGGVLVAFVVEEGLTEEGWTSLAIAAACLAVFYFTNRDGIGAAVDGVVLEDPVEGPGGDDSYDPYAAPAYNPDAAPGEDPYAVPGEDPYVMPGDAGEAADGAADGASGGEADSGAGEAVDFDVDIK